MPLFNSPRSAAAQTDVKNSFGKESDELFGGGGAVDDAVLWQNDVLVPVKMCVRLFLLFFRRHTFLRSLQCGSRRNPGGAILDERGEREH